MDKAYDHKKVEEKIYSRWEKQGYFKPEINPDGKPYSIILPPPNANGALHFGHAMFTVEDILIRYHRMLGEAALWMPGADHAGIETQFVFEKKLKAEGKSRLDFDRETLYKMIEDYVKEHRGGIENQLRRLGFSLDWSREKYTLEPDIIANVYKTFKKMYEDGLVYRDYKLVNYCTFDGTSFSDLEVLHEERSGGLYLMHYKIAGTTALDGANQYIPIATTRPETMFGDEAIMVNPEDARYKNLVGKTVILPLISREIPIIADSHVDITFGTGVVKVTPLHDYNDYEVAKRHNLPMTRQIIGFDGKMMNTGLADVDGLYVKQARKYVLEELRKLTLYGGPEDSEKTSGLPISHKMIINICYKCKNVLEPLPMEQWFIKVKPLTEKAIKAVKEGEIRITPKNFEAQYYIWLENLRDWNISRQIVWGIRIPAWFCEKCSNWEVSEGSVPEKCSKCDSKSLKQDSDTFDTWFSSGQWPYLTLKTTKPGDFEKFYPTSVMETGYDLLKAWVSRMVMLGIYITDEVPFTDILFHGLVNDPYGKKMSKSKGNVVNPMELVDQYGADAVRFALIYGNATGNDQALSYSKLDAMRKFSNKLWNIGRFIEFSKKNISIVKNEKVEDLVSFAEHKHDKEWSEKIKKWSREITDYLNKYQFNFAAERLYEFAWHGFADFYIEDVKTRITSNSVRALEENFKIVLKLLHPFMPFITEELYQKFEPGKSIMIEKWPAGQSPLGGAQKHHA